MVPSSSARNRLKTNSFVPANSWMYKSHTIFLQYPMGEQTVKCKERNFSIYYNNTGMADTTQM
jgi:hypothetical protein